MFKDIKKSMQEQFQRMIKDNSVLFITELTKEQLWDCYLDSFEGESKQEHNCSACKSFIRQYGNIVSIKDNKIVTLWNIAPLEELKNTVFSNTISKMRELVVNSPIRDVFVSDMAKLGVDSNLQRYTVGVDKKQTLLSTPITWNHFFIELPKQLVKTDKSIESIMGEARDNKNVLKRSLDELTQDSVETILELISQNSLYRGEEFKGILTEFLKLKKEYSKTDEKDNFCWTRSTQISSALAKIRNTSIGTLLIDLSEGRELDKAVEAFERVVAPTNYKRPTALVTKRMIEEAEKSIKELGYEESLGRRFAIATDVSINNVLFVNRDAKKAIGVFEELKEDVAINPKTLKKVEEITIDKFLEDVIPTSKGIQVLFENSHLNNLMSIITAKEKEAPTLFKWSNPFSWCYSNAVTDSMRDKVVALGGRVDGVFRFTHSWNELERNQSLMDLHVFMPGCELPTKYSGGPSVRGRRVGWNCRQDSASGGIQDVDYTSVAPPSYIPIENITFPDIKKMPEGKYTCMVHNWGYRSSGGKGKAEIEFDGNIYQYEYPATRNHEWVTIAEVVLKDGKFSIEHQLKESTSSKEKWGISTNKFHKVSMIMNSPNFWDGQAIGNRHTFFIMEGTYNDESPRGLFNEFLKQELDKHKKVFEILGGKMKVEPANKQLSGIGFSSTQRNSIICKVEGKFDRLLKVNL